MISGNRNTSTSLIWVNLTLFLYWVKDDLKWLLDLSREVAKSEESLNSFQSMKPVHV